MPLCVGVWDGVTAWVPEVDCVELGVGACEPVSVPLAEGVPLEEEDGVIVCDPDREDDPDGVSVWELVDTCVAELVTAWLSDIVAD